MTAGLIALALVGAAGPTNAADAYPGKPLKILVGSPAGSLSDVLARYTAQRLGESLKQTVIVDNKPGANGTVMADTVAKSAPDGYTLMLVPDAVMVVNQFVYPKLPYDVEKDFQSVALLGKIDVLLVTHPASGMKSLSDFVQRAKARPKAVYYASGGAGHPTHLMMERVADRLGLELAHVPYKGTAPAIQDVASGQVSAMIVGLAEAMPMMKSGRVIALAASGPGARQNFPSLPLLKDAHADLDLSVWFGVYGPANMPKDIVGRLNAEINRMLEAPEARTRFTDFGMHPLPSLPPTLDELMRVERTSYAPLVKALGLRPE